MLDGIVAKFVNFLIVFDILKDNEQKVYITVHSCIIHSSPKVGPPKCPSTEEWKTKCGTFYNGTYLTIKVK